MKYRNGFVSNSSSTSFIVEDLVERDEIGRVNEPSFIEFIKILRDSNYNADSEATHIEKQGKNDILEWANVEGWEKNYSEIKELFMLYPSDAKVYLIEVNYHDGMNEMMWLFEKTGKLKVLWGM